MSRYSPVFKRDLIQKILSRKDRKVEVVADEHGVSRASVFRWLKEYLADPHGMEMKASRPQDWSAAAKTKALLETRFMNDAELGLYLRANGLYHCHLKEWKEEIIGLMGRNRKLNQIANENEGAILRQRIKELQRELKRKEKALKEASALLALKKKAESIWGVQKDEESPPTIGAEPSNSSTKPKKKAVD